MRSATLLLFVLLTCGIASAQSTLTLKDINGRQFSLSDYKGKVVLINFWATWCPPCRVEIPDLIKKQREYRRQGLQIIGITYPPQKLSEVRRFVRSQGINYRIAMGTEDTPALFTKSQMLPVTIVIDRDGAVRGVIEGIMYADEFDAKVKPLLLKQGFTSKSLFATKKHKKRK
jgi:thiol-disulfide isomerase/thioredoxin